MSDSDFEADSVVSEATFEYFLMRCRNVSEVYFKRWGIWSLGEQVAHVHSEVSEVYQAKRHNEGNARILEEICDSVLSSITMAHVTGFTDSQVMQAMEETLQKIERRAGLREP